MSDDLITWLRAQLDEDERVARAAHQPNWSWYTEDKGVVTKVDDAGEYEQWRPTGTRSDAEHIALHDPARVLAEVEAKRRILDAYADAVRMHGLMEETDSDGKWDWLFRSEALEGVVKLLALPFADRPGYCARWKP